VTTLSCLAAVNQVQVARIMYHTIRYLKYIICNNMYLTPKVHIYYVPLVVCIYLPRTPRVFRAGMVW
jgi:hypothetical protein